MEPKHPAAAILSFLGRVGWNQSEARLLSISNCRANGGNNDDKQDTELEQHRNQCECHPTDPASSALARQPDDVPADQQSDNWIRKNSEATKISGGAET